MSDVRITLVRNDQGDWIGFYLDGQLVDQGHSFEASRVLELAGVAHDEIYDVDLSEEGRLPQDLLGIGALPSATENVVGLLGHDARKVRP